VVYLLPPKDKTNNGVGMKSVLLISVLFFMIQISFANNYYVDDVSSNGNGSLSNPFNNFSTALSTALPGDTIFVLPGIYTLTNTIETKRSGTSSERITLKAFDYQVKPLITRPDRMMKVKHEYITIDGFVFDGQFGDSELFNIASTGDYCEVKNCELKNGTSDGLEVSDTDNVLLENLEIHHMLAGSYSNQQDAHGIVATGENNLTIRGCNIYYVSGDCFQTDPNRDLPLWDNVLIENCKLWTGPLPEDAAGFTAGEVPGENAIDTKINGNSISTGYRPKITIRNVEAHGFVPGFINNRAAFNIKEQVDCRMERILVYNNEVAFRLRGPASRGGAHVTVTNCIAYDNEKVFRTEDDIELLHIYNGTFNKTDDNDYFQNVSGGYVESGFEVMNCLFMGSKPSDASHSSNMPANNSFFIDAPNHDYHLNPNSPAIDSGVDIAVVTADFDNVPRVSGNYDIGAYEYDTSTKFQGEVKPKIKEFKLFNNYPNPFNPSTNISFNILHASLVTLEIYNLLGQKIKTLIKKRLESGNYTYQWDGKNDLGKDLVGGMYFYKMTADNYSHTKKMVLIK
jgi:hypothetical protein